MDLFEPVSSTTTYLENRRGNRCLLSRFNDDLPEGKPKKRFGEFNVYIYKNNRMGNRCSLGEFNDNWYEGKPKRR